MSRNRGRHSVVGVLAVASAHNPGNGKSRESADCLNRAGAARVHKSASQSVVCPEPCQPAAAPHPVREQWIRPTGQNRGRSATSSQPPPVGSAAERYQRGQSNAEHSQQRRKRRGGTIERLVAQKKRPGGDPAPLFAAHPNGVRRPAGESLPRKAAHEIREGRYRQHAQRRHHRMRRAARTPESGADQRESRGRAGNQKYEREAEQGRGVGRSSGGRRDHWCAPRRIGCARITSTSPTISTPIPASTNAIRGASADSNARAVSTIPQPDNRSAKPKSRMHRVPGRRGPARTSH